MNTKQQDNRYLEYNAVLYIENQRTFRENVSHPYSESEKNQARNQHAAVHSKQCLDLLHF